VPKSDGQTKIELFCIYNIFVNKLNVLETDHVPEN